MKILFVSRKKLKGVGGLSRFYSQLVSHFPSPFYPLSPDYISNIFKLPFLKFDLIHLCDATLLPLGAVMKLVFKKPLTVTAHGLDLTLDNFFYQKMLQMCLPQADAVIIDSGPAKKLLLPFGLRPDKIHLISPGISINQFDIVQPVKLPSLNKKKVLLTVGNLVPRKGHCWFIKNVFVNLPDDFVYLIVGEGLQRKAVEKLIHQLKLKNRVFLLGRLSDENLAYVFKKADLYVCPNQHLEGDFEGFGIAAGEAALMGLPVIASQVDGLTGVIKHNRNGLLVTNAQEYMVAIGQFNTRSKRLSFGKKAALFTKKNLNWQKTIQNYIKVFQQVIN